MGLWSREERCSGPACPLSPEKCPLKNPKPPPKMMPCFKSDWGYFSAQAQLTAATCSQGCGIPRPDEGAGPFPCGSESHMAGPSWVSWSGTLQGPLHLPQARTAFQLRGPSRVADQPSPHPRSNSVYPSFVFLPHPLTSSA